MTLSSHLDPEDLRRVYAAYREACLAVIARYDGYLAQFMGDGVMAYFGYPRAHEDDGERAVRAGLDIVAAVRAIRTPAGGQVAVRVGIATGLVVAGDLSAQERAVVGETPNLAARMQTLAAPNSLVIAASTRRLLGDLFQLHPLGAVSVKGLADPVEAWLVESETKSDSRFASARPHRVNQFVGRDREVAALRDRQTRAWQGDAQLVQIVGEAGIGKSRFLARFIEQLGSQDFILVRCQCSPYHTTSAFHPIIEHIRRASGIEPSDPPERQLDKLDAVVERSSLPVADTTPLLAALLSLPTGQRYPSRDLSVAERRHRTLVTLVALVAGLARVQPVLLVIEDIHWADPSTLEVLDLAIGRFRSLPVLTAVTHRPEFATRWPASPHTTNLTLGRLEPDQVQALIRQNTGGRSLPDEITEQILAKADGVPLFVEELTKTILESGLLVAEPDHYRLNGPLPPLAVPETLQDSLMARLDRLAPVKEIAAIGALIGREFSYRLLRAIADRDQPILDAALRQLEDAELLFRVGAPPDFRYRFKHALVQDAAYESLLKTRRQVLHQRIAEVLSEESSATPATEPELIAHHYTLAGMTGAAIDWWTKAGESAAGRSAYVESSAHYGHAVALSDTMPPEPARQTSRLKLQVTYAQSLSAVRTPGAPETAAAFARARELANEIADPTERISLYYGMWASSFVRGEVHAAETLAETFRDIAHRQTGTLEAILAHRVLGVTASLVGDLPRARDHLRQALAPHHAKPDGASQSRYGHDLGVGGIFNLAITQWQLGSVREAIRMADEGLSTALITRHHPTMIFGYFYKCVFEAQRHNPIRLTPSAQALYDLCVTHFPRSGWQAGSTFLLGWSRWVAGDHEAGTSAMRRGLAYFRDAGVITYPMLYRGLYAQTQARGGDADAALATLADCLMEAERMGLAWMMPEIHRFRAEALLLGNTPDRDASEGAYRTAIDMARGQSARSFELRAAVGLARLFRDTDRVRDIPALLAPVMDALKDETDLPEVREAQTLLVGTR